MDIRYRFILCALVVLVLAGAIFAGYSALHRANHSLIGKYFLIGKWRTDDPERASYTIMEIRPDGTMITTSHEELGTKYSAWPYLAGGYNKAGRGTYSVRGDRISLVQEKSTATLDSIAQKKIKAIQPYYCGPGSGVDRGFNGIPFAPPTGTIDGPSKPVVWRYEVDGDTLKLYPTWLNHVPPGGIGKVVLHRVR